MIELMPYAITLRFDEATEATAIHLRTALWKKVKLAPKLSDTYAPHVTLAVFDDLVSSEPLALLRAVSCEAAAVRILFGGIGVFRTEDRFTVFIPIVPSGELLEIHSAAHRRFCHERRWNQHYDEGRWLPHCTVASGVNGRVNISTILRLASKQTACEASLAAKIELVFSPDIKTAPVKILYSEPLKDVAHILAQSHLGKNPKVS